MTKDEWAALHKEKGMILYARSGNQYIRCRAETLFDDANKRGAVLRVVRADEDGVVTRGYYPCETILTERQARAWRDKTTSENGYFRELEPRKCAECGKEFIPRTKNQTLCSPECRARHNSRVGHEHPITLPGTPLFTKRKCIVCGEEFYPKTANQKTCSPECSSQHHHDQETERSKARKRNKGKKVLLDKVCPVCGEPFQTYRPGKKTCCKACAAEWRERYRRSNRKEKAE